jgi:hypothetical protein
MGGGGGYKYDQQCKGAEEVAGKSTVTSALSGQPSFTFSLPSFSVVR